jgi:hypothetical protein
MWPAHTAAELTLVIIGRSLTLGEKTVKKARTGVLRNIIENKPASVSPKQIREPLKAGHECLISPHPSSQHLALLALKQSKIPRQLTVHAPIHELRRSRTSERLESVFGNRVVPVKFFMFRHFRSPLLLLIIDERRRTAGFSAVLFDLLRRS